MIPNDMDEGIGTLCLGIQVSQIILHFSSSSSGTL
jgi:hypothetical protein